MGEEEKNIISEKEPVPEKNSTDAHLEGFSEDDKKLIRLVAEIFVNSIMERAYKNQQT